MPKKAELDVLDLEAFLPYQLNRASEIVSKGFARIYGDRHGLTRPEWRTLATLGLFGTATATRIAAHSGMHKTKVSRAVASLERRRWLRREHDAADRRVENLALTRLGREAYADLVVVARAYQRHLMEAIGSQTEVLQSVLARIPDKLAAEESVSEGRRHP